MKIEIHQHNNQKIAEIIGDGVFIKSVDDAFQIMMNLSYSGVQKVIFHKNNLSDEFFDLKTKILGETFQKAVNYHMQIAIVGDFSKIESKSLKDLIYESNKGRHYFFAQDIPSALDKLS